MKARVNMKQLKRVMKGIGKINNPYRLTTAYTLVEVKGNRVFFHSTDTNDYLIVSCPAQVSEEGSVCLQIRSLSQILKNFKKGEVEITNERITTPAGSFATNTIPALDFPKLTYPIPDARVAVEGKKLAEMIERTISSVRKESNDFALEGVLVEVENGKLSLVGCDGYRLAIYSTEVASDLSFHAVIRQLAMKVLFDVLTDRDVHLGYFDEEHFFFASDDVTIITPPLKEEYPNYKSVIPKDNENVLVVPLEEFRYVTEATRKTEYAELTLTEKEMKIKAMDFEGSIPVAYRGQEMKIAINPDLLYKPLKPLKGKNLIFYIKDGNTPILLKEESNEEWTFVFMPCRLYD